MRIRIPGSVPLTNGSGSLYPSQHLYEKREGSGSGARSGSIPLTNESGSRRPKNMQIRRLRIPNTGCYYTLWHAPPPAPLPPPPWVALTPGLSSQPNPLLMDEGTIKTPISKCHLQWCLCLGRCSNFVGSESGQKQSV
jgi:hypothetical protein